MILAVSSGEGAVPFVWRSSARRSFSTPRLSSLLMVKGLRRPRLKGATGAFGTDPPSVFGCCAVADVASGQLRIAITVIPHAATLMRPDVIARLPPRAPLRGRADALG